MRLKRLGVNSYYAGKMPCYICRTSRKAFINRENDVRYHVFPTSRHTILREWKKFACIPEGVDVSRLMLCSKHFKEEDIVSTPLKTILLKTAVPCLLPPQNPDMWPVSSASSASEDVVEESNLTSKQHTNILEEPRKSLEAVHVLENVRKQLCRVCGRRETLLKPIFETLEEMDCEESLAMKIEMHLPIKVGVNDNLPPNICSKCSDMLHHWHELHVTCLSADTVLQKIFCGTREKEASNIPYEKVSSKNDRKEEKPNGVLETDNCAVPEDSNIFFNSENTANIVHFEEKRNIKFEDKRSDLLPSNQPTNYVKPFLPSCSYCHEFFYYSDDCRNHILECQHLPALCEACGEKVSQRKQLGKHRRKHAQRKLQNFICEKCAKCVTSARALQYHLTFVHERATPPEYYCEPCCKVIYRKFNYQLHMKRHALGKIKSAKFDFVAILKNKNSAVYLCPACDDVFGDKLSLILHLTTQKSLNCPTCQKSFQNEKKLILHKCRKWFCSDCDEPFSNKHEYETHLRVHSKTCSTTEKDT